MSNERTDFLDLDKWSLQKDTVNEQNSDNNSNLEKIDNAVKATAQSIHDEKETREGDINSVNNQINSLNDKISAIESGSPVEDIEIKLARRGFENLTESIQRAGINIDFKDPTPTDNGFSFWLNANTNILFILKDATEGNSIWVEYKPNDISTDQIGDLNELKTNNKANLVSAINELFKDMSKMDKDVLFLQMKDALRDKEDSTGVTGLHLTEIFDNINDFTLIEGYYDEQNQLVRIL